MKRIVPLVLVLLILTGCKIKEYTPEIPLTFTQRAEVVSGDFSFECEICKTKDSVITTVLSTDANGMTMTYNGDTLDFDFYGYSHSVDGNGFEPSNISIIIYEVFEKLSTSEMMSKKIDGGYQYQGRISVGDFTLLQNDDNTLKSITIKCAGIVITFE